MNLNTLDGWKSPELKFEPFEIGKNFKKDFFRFVSLYFFFHKKKKKEESNFDFLWKCYSQSTCPSAT